LMTTPRFDTYSVAIRKQRQSNSIYFYLNIELTYRNGICSFLCFT